MSMSRLLGWNFDFDKFSLEELECRVHCDLASAASLAFHNVKNTYFLFAGSPRTNNEALHFFVLKPLRPVSKHILAFILVPPNSTLNSLDECS